MTSNSAQNWSGRVDSDDGASGLRWHQVVRDWQPESPPGVAFVGFVCDEGVRRNKGRVGAAGGPAALRATMSNLPFGLDTPLIDAGDVTCISNDLELAHGEYSALITSLLRSGHFPIGLGGGHEIAWGSFSGLASSGVLKPKGRLGILNLDAHFDLRHEIQATSGTSFLRALESSAALEIETDYQVLGISESSNTLALFETAFKMSVSWRCDRQMTLLDLNSTLSDLSKWISSIDDLYLTICLDVLPASTAPGVSAPAARGVSLEVIEPIVDAVAASGKLRIADVAELNPRFDIDDRTARTAARLIWRIVQGLPR